jgi:L-2-hydroxyglutarate oxidase LhgO
MSRCAAVPIAVSSIERQVLTARARRASGEQRDVLRARIVLAAAGGQSNAAIARKLGITGDY